MCVLPPSILSPPDFLHRYQRAAEEASADKKKAVSVLPSKTGIVGREVGPATGVHMPLM